MRTGTGTGTGRGGVLDRSAQAVARGLIQREADAGGVALYESHGYARLTVRDTAPAAARDFADGSVSRSAGAVVELAPFRTAVHYDGMGAIHCAGIPKS